MIEGARIELRPGVGGNDVIVDVQRKRFRLFDLGRSDIVLRVVAPHGADVELATASADVRGRGRFGSLDAKTASGDLAFGDVAGRARISSASGDVALDRVGGDATVNTASGDVRVGRVEGDAVLRSASGDVTVEEAEARCRCRRLPATSASSRLRPGA